MKFSREVKTAILILGCFAIFILGFNYLKGTSLLDNKTQLSALYENVEGLNVGAHITINGLNVGSITEIDFDKNFEKIIVRFNVREDLNFSNQSIAQIYETGLIGGKAIEILPVYDPSNTIQDGDILPSNSKPGLTECSSTRKNQ
ncbi:MAG: MlaD family protein [Flavobacteriaceae bacterium]